MIKYISQKLQDAELVLVGLGEDLDLLKLVKQDARYLQMKEKTDDEWILSLVEKQLIMDMQDKILPMYEQLERCINNKNYFIVSVCQDDSIDKVGLNAERIVKPCGGFHKLQCSKGCTKDLFEPDEKMGADIKQLLNGKILPKDIKRPLCPICGEPLVFNSISASSYIEEGYLPKWQVYTKWLQGTVNKKLCVLELGVGMKYPTVIRWPFEKITFFNQKAELFRVHNRLYQISEEIKERGHGICQEPSDFLKELFNQC